MPATSSKLDPATPPDVEVTAEPRVPVTDPKVGVEVSGQWHGQPRHRLVAIGDSLTHGFQSGVVFNTALSYSAIIAYELGWYDAFRHPAYNGVGGLPLNIEFLLRDLESQFGADLDWWEVPLALFRGRQFMDKVEDYWERGPGTTVPNVAGINHALAVYGYDLRDALVNTARTCKARIGPPKDDLFSQIVENHADRAALRVFPTIPEEAQDLTLFGAARSLGNELGDPAQGGDPDYGIETLIVFLGVNNALPAVTSLRVVWSLDGYDDVQRKRDFTVGRPTHFTAELASVAQQVRDIKARHVIWCTVPHVTIAPIARGVGGKIAPGSRYFPYYTRPWITDNDFNPHADPNITGQQARAVDSAIDQYNYAITDVVRAARAQGGTGICSTSPDYWIGWPLAAISTTRTPGRTGGSLTPFRRSCLPLPRCPTPGS